METRYDLEFMGRMLGMHTCPTCDTLEDAKEYVERHMRDPVANARAQQRIGALLADLSFLLDGDYFPDYPEPATEPAPLLAMPGFRRGKVGLN